ncbi:aspartokinase [Desulfosporosinus orientis DSM 765]|uniref:aspartate kinase n=1 Tax=Desulfosporosinus orientis (strain ATCC 19365 / DSM 765 / NCIMB 8382 / VKM B-1628 / Singapore I) TaxID=768706 RepID=G7WE44_DESOD|nr:aspartate kinase [Desulfosporosinus orientis]AET69442.1 aspartokinase [Desulfosporosinus orientis DSM 765]
MLTVEKIGGTSMLQFQNVLKDIIGYPGSEGFRYGRVFVVSAYAGITNMLLEDKKTKAPGIYQRFIKGEDYESAMDELLNTALEINSNFVSLGLDAKICRNFMVERVEQTKAYLNSMEDIIASGYVGRESIYSAARELLASIGEAHSAFNTVNILRNNSIQAKLVDLTGFRDPKQLSISERIEKSFKNVDTDNAIIVATGYTKGIEGIMREYERGYSEITFSKIATQLHADEAIIHKEFHLSSADPKIVGVEKAIPVGRTNYDVADQLADIGMEAIHPNASKPLEMAGINLRIKNTFEPNHPGTVISNDYIGPQAKIEIIAGSDKVVILEIHDSSMVGETGFDLDIMRKFKNYNISYIMKTTNANSISLVIWEADFEDALVEDLKADYRTVTVQEAAIVCVIGSNIAMPRILARAANALAKNEINIKCVSQSLRQVNMQFVIDRTMYATAIKCLNEDLCWRNHVSMGEYLCR